MELRCESDTLPDKLAPEAGALRLERARVPGTREPTTPQRPRPASEYQAEKNSYEIF